MRWIGRRLFASFFQNCAELQQDTVALVFECFCKASTLRTKELRAKRWLDLSTEVEILLALWQHLDLLWWWQKAHSLTPTHKRQNTRIDSLSRRLLLERDWEEPFNRRRTASSCLWFSGRGQAVLMEEELMKLLICLRYRCCCFCSPR